MRIVLKIGGSIIDQDLTKIAVDIDSFLKQGNQIVVVHGGAKLVTR
ncbi:MAG: amino acid kinase family protein, partial [Candidatus Ranarchaeia archaeon]